MTESHGAREGVLDAASSRIRETAKWITVSLAALGAVVVAGTQLSDIGALAVGSPRFWVAIGGAVLAAAGVISVLGGAVWTAISPAMSLKRLAENPGPKGTDEATSDPTLRSTYDDVAALKEGYLKSVAERDAAYNTYQADQTDSNLDAFQTAEAQAIFLNDTVRGLLEVASYLALTHRWKVAVRWIIGGGLAAAVGIGLFAWAANPPDAAKATVATPAILEQPKPGTLLLNASGQEALRGVAGPNCALNQPLPALNLGSTQAGPDILVGASGDCETIRFVLTTSWGTLSD